MSYNYKKKELFKFSVEATKKQIEDEILKNILEYYDIDVKKIDPLPEDRNRWDKQLRFKVIYFPRTMMFDIKLPVFEKEFIIREEDLEIGK